MARPRKPDHLRLLEGRSPGRDSGGRKVQPSMPAGGIYEPAPAPPMPRGRLSPAVKQVWRRTAKLLRSTPDQDTMAGYCQAVVQRDLIAAKLESGDTVPESGQSRLEREIRRFRAEFIVENASAAILAPPIPTSPDGPFASEGRRRKVPSLIKSFTPGTMPKRVIENACPPRDPQYHQVWVAAITESDRNHKVRRPPGFLTREFHYNDRGELHDEFWPESDGDE